MVGFVVVPVETVVKVFVADHSSSNLCPCREVASFHVCPDLTVIDNAIECHIILDCPSPRVLTDRLRATVEIFLEETGRPAGTVYEGAGA